jgi:hypothetical protein
VSGALDVHQPGLGGQPLRGPSEVPFDGQVVHPGRIVGPPPAPSAHRHASVRFGGVVLVELAADV